MPTNLSDWNAQKQAWRILNGLRPAAIDLGRIHLIRERSSESLSRASDLENLLLELGLNDEGLDEFPLRLRQFCGAGLRIWQYPVQFSRYLARMATLRVRSYLELGIRHGGSFVATVEILDRFFPLESAIGVDVIPCPSMAEYKTLNPRIEFCCLNTQSGEFGALIDRIKPVDLVFIDSHHEETQCRREFEALRESARMIAFHDVLNRNCPGVGRVWQEVKTSGDYECSEYTEQYDDLGPYMGIGLAIRKERVAQ
jgi:hypothetical protein